MSAFASEAVVPIYASAPGWDRAPDRWRPLSHAKAGGHPRPDLSGPV